MHDLRLIGVHEDGTHLLFSDADGEHYRAPLDEPMRAAARRDRARLGQLQIDIDGGMRPREVQSLIRAGLSREEVAHRSGWSLEKVERFEGPVLAEREYIAAQARSVVLASAPSRARSQATQEPVTLGELALERLRERGVPDGQIRWDAARREDGEWRVTVHFPAGGKERTGSWRFDHRLRSIFPTSDEARWLSEDSHAHDAIPTPHTAQARPSSAVFDIEAHGGVDSPPESKEALSPTGGPRSPSGERDDERTEPLDLMAKIREQSHRSRRRKATPSKRTSRAPTATPGGDTLREDALPIEELTMDPAQAPEPPVARDDHPISAYLGPDAADHDDDDDHHDDLEHSEDPRVRNRGSNGAPESGTKREGDDDPAAAESGPTPPQAVPASQKRNRKGRASVPSWDDIMFGGRGGGA